MFRHLNRKKCFWLATRNYLYDSIFSMMRFRSLDTFVGSFNLAVKRASLLDPDWSQ